VRYPTLYLRCSARFDRPVRASRLIAAYSSTRELDGRTTGIAHAPTAGDPALVERLIANLLDNAVRYNVPGGRVEISTRVEGDKAIVSIANTGPVIPPEQVHRLFEPFQRLDRTRVDDHHGLGLSIVRAIAIAHDATLTGNARPQGGLSIVTHFRLIPFAMPR
jgi:signal transduction histidine kinase